MSDLEGEDSVGELPSAADPYGMTEIQELIQKEHMNNPSQFVSNWEADEQDVDEATEEEKKKLLACTKLKSINSLHALFYELYVGCLPDDPVKRILWAAETGKADIVNEMLSLSCDLLSAKDADGYTPLHRAAYEGQTEIVQLLLDRGADLNECTNDGWTALHSACCWGQVDTASMLLRHGSNINAQTNGHLTPLHLAAGGNSSSPDLFQLLLMNEFIQTDLVNHVGERPRDIAQRSNRHHKLFCLADKCINALR